MEWIKIETKRKIHNRRLLSGKDLLIKYDELYLTGMYLLDDFWYYDVSGELSKLMFQDKVTQVSIIDETNYLLSRRKRTNLSHHRWYSVRAQCGTHRPMPRSYYRNHQSRSSSATASPEWVIHRRQDRLVQNTQRYGIHYQKFINQNQYGRKVRNNNKERLEGII